MSKADFSFFPYEIPLGRSYNWAFGAGTLGRGVLVQCNYGQCSGWGEVAFEPQSLEDPRSLAEEAKLFASRWSPDLCHPDEIALHLIETENIRVRSRIRCGVVNAWLACVGHVAKKRVSDLFCHEPSREVSLNGFVGCDDPVTAVKLCAEYQSLGVQVVKCKGSIDIAADVDRLEVLRASFPTLGLRIDPNGCWSQEGVKLFLDRLVALNLEYVEEPFTVSSSSYQHIEELLGPVPFALDHWGRSLKDIEALLECCKPRAVILKQQLLGGFDKAHAVKAILEQRGVLCVVTCSLETLIGINLAAELAATLTEEVACGLMLWQYYPQTLLPWPDVRKGKITVPLSVGSPNLEVL